MKKSVVSTFLCFLIFLLIFSVNAFGVNGQGIVIEFKDGDLPLVDAEFNLYYVGTVSGNKIIPTEKFVSYPVSFDISDSEKLENFAVTLNSYVSTYNISESFKDFTDSDGIADFDGKKFDNGVYLLTAKKHHQNGKFYFCKPTIVVLPVNGFDNVTIKPKFETEDDSTETKVSVKVIKAWENDSVESRPESIEVNLLKDAEIFATVTLSEENSWKFQWTELSPQYRWTVSENGVPFGYTVSISQYGNAFLITNTADEDKEETTVSDEYFESTTKVPTDELTEPETEKPELPATGMLLWPIPYLALFGILLFTVGFVIKRKSETENE